MQRKFYYLKHKPDTERNQKTSLTTTIQDNTLKPTYASILKNNTNAASNSINQNTNLTGERPTLQQKRQSFTLKHSSRSKSPTRKVSKTNQQNQSNEIAALKAEIEELKQKQNSKSTEAKTHEESNSTSENSKTTQHPKNWKK